MKTSELTGAALDWAVAKAERLDCYVDMRGSRNGWAAFVDFGEHTHIRYTPSEHWGFGGPIIEREGITVSKEEGCWSAYFRENLFEDDGSEHWQNGPTPLIAAMRCLVASRLGDEVEVPEELK